MVGGCTHCRWWVPAVLASALLLLLLWVDDSRAAKPLRAKKAAAAASQTAPPAEQPDQRAPQLLAERSDAATRSVAPEIGTAQPNEHPLMPALRWAHEGLGNIEKIHDYSATLVKRERIGGKIGEYEYMLIKVRHNPFSVYMHFLAPAEIKGQEVIYIEGQNNGHMWAHTIGVRDAMFGTVSIPPNGLVAMHNQRYPLTELGILNMVRRLVEVGEQDIKYAECEVKFFKGAKINSRTCTCIQVVHPVPRRNFLFHLARIFVDDELNVPVRYEAYGWPKETGGAPELDEEYTYLNLKLNNGYTDSDFDKQNPNYHFR
jgi:hypothetical protein